MKIAVVGKGGVGKTTTTGTVARLLARQGFKVIALDCDVNPNLGLSAGLSLAETERLAAIRQALDAAEEDHAPTIPEMLARFGAWAPDEVRVAVVSQIDNMDPG